jgi:hypothetical protein
MRPAFFQHLDRGPPSEDPAWEAEAAYDGRDRDGRWWQDGWNWISQHRAKRSGA